MSKEDKQDSIDNMQEIPGMNLDSKYSLNKAGIPENLTSVQKEMDKTKKELEKVKSWIVKKYPFTLALSILPPQATRFFVDEEEVPKETEKHLQLFMIIPEDEFKNIPKIKKEIVTELEKLKEKVWLQIKTPVDIGENCLDSKFELFDAVAMSFPLYDKGFLGAMRVSSIHKSLVLQKFDKYIVSYVIVGSFMRGEATPTSDLDVFIVINDTDVKRMPRLELKERLRTMIYQYVSEAMALAGVKNSLHVQTYLLTDFWESVKDANPVIFTFIRDGIPIYDRGTFLPWKALLRMGKLKPTPESVDLFMKSAEKTQEMVERRLLDAMIDVYYGVLNPSQALIMLYGAPPPTHKETVKLMNEIFVEKEKMLKKPELTILEKAIKMFKEYEHDLKFKVSGKEVDQLVKDYNVYITRLKELRVQIEKRAMEKTVEQIYEDVFNLLKILLGKKSQEQLVKDFELELVKTGKFTSQHLKILNNIIQAKADFKKGKLDSHKVDEARKNAMILINDLIDYSQRKDIALLERGKIRLKYKHEAKDAYAELLVLNNQGFLIRQNSIKKLTDKIENSNAQELSEAIQHQKNSKELVINPRVFELARKELGDFEIMM